MELSKLEIQILIDVYDADMSASEPINVNNYELTEELVTPKYHEFAFYLLKLKRLEFLDFNESKAFMKGMMNDKYKNNFIMCNGEEIHISERGRLIVEEAKKSALQKIKDKGVDVAKGLAGALKDEFNDLFSKTVSEYLKNIGQG